MAAFHMLGTGEAFHGLGEGYLDQVARKRSTIKLVRRLGNPGYDVMLVPQAAWFANPSIQRPFPERHWMLIAKLALGRPCAGLMLHCYANLGAPDAAIQQGAIACSIDDDILLSDDPPIRRQIHEIRVVGIDFVTEVFREV